MRLGLSDLLPVGSPDQEWATRRATIIGSLGNDMCGVSTSFRYIQDVVVGKRHAQKLLPTGPAFRGMEGREGQRRRIAPGTQPQRGRIASWPPLRRQAALEHTGITISPLPNHKILGSPESSGYPVDMFVPPSGLCPSNPKTTETGQRLTAPSNDPQEAGDTIGRIHSS